MLIIVVSDTHGDTAALLKALNRQPKAELVIHLGDGAAEIDTVKPLFPEKMFLQVKGNCDFGSTLPDADEYTVSNVKIFYTHGHLYDVKQQSYKLISAARDRHAGIVLYGHTHHAESLFEDGLYIINPGSLRGCGGSYAAIDISDQGILVTGFKI